MSSSSPSSSPLSSSSSAAASKADLAVNLAVDLAPQAQRFLPRGDGSRSTLVSLVAREHLQKIIVRARDKNALAAVGKAFSCKLPQNNKTTTTKDATLLWMGPDEVLFRSHESAAPPLERVVALEKQLQKTFAAVVDVSDYYVVVRVEGARAQKVLQKNCPLDFHESVFQRGDCAQSLYGKAPVLVNRATDDGFDLQVRISLAPYLWGLLALATQSEHP